VSPRSPETGPRAPALPAAVAPAGRSAAPDRQRHRATPSPACGHLRVWPWPRCARLGRPERPTARAPRLPLGKREGRTQHPCGYGPLGEPAAHDRQVARRSGSGDPLGSAAPSSRFAERTPRVKSCHTSLTGRSPSTGPTTGLSRSPPPTLATAVPGPMGCRAAAPAQHTHDLPLWHLPLLDRHPHLHPPSPARHLPELPATASCDPRQLPLGWPGVTPAHLGRVTLGGRRPCGGGSAEGGGRDP
jgi:hypothetical protein